MHSIIKAINYEELNLPLTEPFGISGGAPNTAHNVLVTATLADGTIGLGEAAPLPPYNGETQAIVIDALKEEIPKLLNSDAHSIEALSESLRRNIPHSGSAICALEMAILDALTRQEQIPLWKFFGTAQTAIETDMTITTQSGHTVSEAVAHARSSAEEILSKNIKIIKTKVGLGNEVDVARIKAIREVIPECPLILDGNGAFSAESALKLLELLYNEGIIPVVFEQPTAAKDIEGLRFIKGKTQTKVAADESVKDLETAAKVIDIDAVDIVNLKTMKKGIFEAVAIGALFNENGYEVMIGGNVETILSMTASAHISHGIGWISRHDLDTPHWIAQNPFQGGFHQDGSVLCLDHIRAGHGVTPTNR